MIGFLDESLCSNLRYVVNSHDMFYRDETERQYFALLCATMDRVEDCARELRTYGDRFLNQNHALLFMMHASIVRDAIRTIAWNLGVQYKEIVQSSPSFFGTVCCNDLGLSATKIPDDDAFFEYIRSLTFAHPLGTSRASLLRKGEVQYSPFVNVRSFDVEDADNCLIIYIYSNMHTEQIILHVSIEALKGYLHNRYMLLENITKALQQRIVDKENIWRQRKVKRDISQIEILEDILSIQEERYIHTYEIRSLISILKCRFTDSKNQESLNKVHQDISDMIPALCDAVDNMNNEEFFTLIDTIVDARPKQTYESFGYHMEKIFAYLNDDVLSLDKNWGLQQADDFSKRFAQKWVKIDVHNMDFEEIKVLVMVACYLEAQEQERNAV